MHDAGQIAQYEFREGRNADLRAAFALFERTLHETGHRMGAEPPGGELNDEEVERNWQRERPLVEYLAAQPGCFWVAENEDGLVGFARSVQFDRMDELTEVGVAPVHQGRGVGRALIERCWPDTPTAEVGRLTLATGALVDLSLYPDFGVMPVTGHWHLSADAVRYLEARSLEQTDGAEPAVHVLKADGAVAEWKRLEPPAIGYERPLLHDFFGRERTCLAHVGDDGDASALCWVGPGGYIGPGVGARAEDLVPVVLAALDRVAKTQEPDTLHVFCTTDSWWLLRRLLGAGFRVTWPSWVMCSEPLPGLDRYLPTRPSLIL